MKKCNGTGLVLKICETKNNVWKKYRLSIQNSIDNHIKITYIKPNFANISDSHLDLYGSKENIFYDKSSLERYANEDATIIINYDDEILKKAQYSHNVITISKFDENADYYVKDFYMGLDGTYFTVFFKGGKRKIHLNLYGEHNIYNALAAFAVGILAGISDKDIAESLEKYHSSGMRQNLINVGGFNIFMDTFNAEPQTVLGAADTLESLELGNNQRKIFVTGHIDKLGEKSIEMHTQLGHDLAKKKLDLVALFNGDAKYTYDAMLDDGCENVFYTDNRDELDNWLEDNVTRNDILFCKSGQFKAALAKSIDHVYGTAFQNEQQYNEGKPASVDGFQLKLRQDNIAEIVGYTGTKSNVVVPSTFEEYQIVRIAAGAFSRNQKITSITIPDTVNSIGEDAFYLCKRLESVDLSKNLRYIGDNAFNSCLALQSVIIPEETIHLGRRAFYDCKSLKTSTLPNSLGFIGKECFGGLTDTVCICNEGSYAHKYAEEHGNLRINTKPKKNSKFNKLLNKIIR